MALVKQIDIATTLTPQFTVSVEGDPSPVKQALIEYLQPTFTIRSDIVGDYTYAPYGKTEGSWLIPLLLLGLIVLAIRGRK